MNCREVKRLLKNSYSPTFITSRGVTTHVRSCQKCSQELAISRLTDVLMNSYSDFNSQEESPWADVRLINQIKSRIHSLEKGTVTWDAAVIGVRGWLLAFSALAILLLVLSGELGANRKLDPANWSAELVSTNAVPNFPPEEETENAH